ncbi:hypothetical protein [Flavobacterium sp. 3-210]
MTGKEKEAVKDHINKTAGWNENSKGYQAIKQLFDNNEWYMSMQAEPDLYFGIAQWLRKIGLEVEIRRQEIKLDEDALRKYYINVMGLQTEPKEEEKSYYERYIVNKKND